MSRWQAPDVDLIDGVRIKQLEIHADERGMVQELLRCDEEIFVGFGQAYLCTVRPGIVKAWHRHEKQHDHFCCIRGEVKLVLYDDRDDSETKGTINEFVIGERNPLMVQFPPGVVHGFACVGDVEAFVLNFPEQPYNADCPDEFRLEPWSEDVPFDWYTSADG